LTESAPRLPSVAEVSAVEGRGAATGAAGSERYRRSFLSSLGLLGAKVVTTAAAFVVVPILVGHLGAERYGLLLTASAAASLLSVLDLGVPGALVGALAEAQARDEGTRAARLLSTAALMLSSLAFLGGMLLAGGLIAGRGALGALGVPAEAVTAFAVLLGGFLVGLPLSVTDAAWKGLQQGYRASLWQVASAGLNLLLIWGAVSRGMGLSVVAAVYALAPLSGTALSSVDLFGRVAPWLRPRLRLAGLVEARDLLGRAGPLLRLQWAGVVNNQTDSLVIAGLAGLPRVGEYGVTARLFSPLQSLVSMLLLPLWPAYAEADALQDRAWVARTLKRSVVLAAVLAIPAAAAIVLVGQQVVRLWVGPGIEPPFGLLLAFGAWVALACVSQPFGLYLVGTGFPPRLASLALAGAAVNLALSLLLVRGFGPAGAVWASVLAQGLFLTVPAILETRRRLSPCA
jgi:O-antigen/teichoic acid export membrane protein